MRRFLVVLLVLLALTSTASARDLEGVTLPEQLQGSDGTSLVLNGAGLRSKWFLDLYVAGLYLEAKSSDPQQLIRSDRPMLLRLEIISGLITSEKMEAATREGFTKAAAEGYVADPGEIEAFLGVFREAIKKGDRFDLAFRVDSGVMVFKNGTPRLSVLGHSFKQALFAIWLGKEPAQASLKRELLGATR